MFNFLLTSDIIESSLLKANGVMNISQELQTNLLNLANEWYLEECISFGVDEDDIMVYNPNTDIKDERNRTMVRLVLSYYLIEAFYSEWGKKDDIYDLKLPRAEKTFGNLQVKMNYYRIIGESPVLKTSASFTSFTRRRG